MANSKRRCKSCRDYFKPEELVKSGLGTLCVDCIPTSFQKQTKKARTKAVEKRKADGFTTELKDEIKKRDDYSCRLCGKSSSYLQVHHIVYRSHKTHYESTGGYMNHPSNLITLCQSCHGTRAHGLEAGYYAEQFRKVIWLFYVDRRFVTVSAL